MICWPPSDYIIFSLKKLKFYGSWELDNLNTLLWIVNKPRDNDSLCLMNTHFFKLKKKRHLFGVEKLDDLHFSAEWTFQEKNFYVCEKENKSHAVATFHLHSVYCKIAFTDKKRSNN